MKKIMTIVSSLALAGCLSAPFKPPVGMVSVVQAPLSTDGNWTIYQNRGESSSYCVLGIAAVGDCSVSAAAKNGGIKKVGHVDYEYKNILGIWQEVKVVVYGE